MVNAQSFDNMVLRNRYVNCPEVTFNAGRLVSELYKKAEIDSVYDFLDYWENKCGPIHSIYPLRILLDIKTANFDSAQISDDLFNQLIYFKLLRNDLSPYYPITEPFSIRDYREAVNSINQEIINIAADIEQTYSEDEALLVDFFKSDSPDFTNIKAAVPENSKLKRIHDKELNTALQMPEYHMGIFAGYYQPLKKLEVFGPHATIGLILGVKKERHNFDLVMDVRMGRSKEEYEFIYKGTLLKDDWWTSLYVGLEYTYNFIETKKIRAGVSPGFGYNGVTAVRGDEEEGIDAKILPSYDINGGLVMKYHFGKKGAYGGLQLRYHWVDHRNAGGTELAGNYLTARLVFGSIFNEWRDYKLDRLK